MTKTALRTRSMAYTAMMVALMAICAWISIPTAAVSFTMQTFGVYVAAGLLGARRGTAAVAVYILLGAVGLPVFSNMTGGIGALAGTTGGYIVGFIFLAAISGAVSSRVESKAAALAGMLTGTAVCYAFGTAWYMVLYTANTGPVGLLTVLGACVFPFILPDILKMLLALAVIRAVKPHIQL